MELLSLFYNLRASQNLEMTQVLEILVDTVEGLKISMLHGSLAKYKLMSKTHVVNLQTQML